MENPLSVSSGPHGENAWRGNGIANMTARAGALNGYLTAFAEPEAKRYVIQLSLPLAQVGQMAANTNVSMRTPDVQQPTPISTSG
jgi:hypothetical protein